MADECEFYYYDSGYSCAVKRADTGNSSVDKDTVDKYCWGYHYEDCPRYKKKKDSSGGCYLTSACVEAKGLSDNCYELSTLRKFRDGYLASSESGKEDIKEYYDVAPRIVSNIKKRPDAIRIFEKIYKELVLPCVKLIETGENEQARQHYCQYTLALKELYT